MSSIFDSIKVLKKWIKIFEFYPRFKSKIINIIPTITTKKYRTILNFLSKNIYKKFISLLEFIIEKRYN